MLSMNFISGFIYLYICSDVLGWLVPNKLHPLVNANYPLKQICRVSKLLLRLLRSRGGEKRLPHCKKNYNDNVNNQFRSYLAPKDNHHDDSFSHFKIIVTLTLKRPERKGTLTSKEKVGPIKCITLENIHQHSEASDL